MLEQTRENEDGETVPVGITWVAKQLGITNKMLRGWLKQEEAIVASSGGSRQVEKVRKARWEDMEKQLYEKFEEVRALGKPVGQRWFKREGKRIFAAVYSTAMDRSISQCAFSEGWFRRFCERWNIS